MQARLVVWVEGDSDRWFLEAVVQPRLQTKFIRVVVKAYSQSETKAVNKTLRALEHQGFSRLFLADLDSAPCITDRKQKVREHHPDVEDREIIVVSTEIESWYLAGLSSAGAAALKIRPPSTTDHMTKDQVDLLRPARFATRILFLLELLRHFDPAAACQRNRSFAYFYRMLL